MNLRPLPENRIVRGAIDAELSWQPVDSDGDADDVSAYTVTVAVTRSDGTAVTTGAVSAGSGSNPYTATVALAETASVDLLTAVWSLDGTEVFSERVEVVGGTIGSVAAIQAVETSLSAESDVVMKRSRRAAEDRFVSTQGRSPFTRLHVQRFDGTGTPRLRGAHFPDLVSVAWVRVYTNATAYTALIATELAAIKTPDEMSVFERLDGKCWAAGRDNIEVGYVFGLEALPTDLRTAMYHAVRQEASATNTGVPDNATTWGSVDGINFGIATPGQRGAVYGVPKLDDVWIKYRDPRPAVA